MSRYDAVRAVRSGLASLQISEDNELINKHFPETVGKGGSTMFHWAVCRASLELVRSNPICNSIYVLTLIPRLILFVARNEQDIFTFGTRIEDILHQLPTMHYHEP